LFYAWKISPTEWINASPAKLRSDFAGNYLLWVAEQYESNGDQEWVREELGVQYWDEKDFNNVWAAFEAKTAELGGEEVVRLRALEAVVQNIASGAGAPVEPPADTPAEAGGGGTIGSIVGICGVAILVIAVVLAAVFFIRRMMAQRAGLVDDGLGVGIEPPEAVDWGADGPPLVQFVTNYVFGDDHYDPSFSIEMENGEFMGECGVGVSESIGVGAPNKVTAFEVWLFDKSDIRTVTKVLLSDYAFGDEAMRAKLAPKGEPVLAKAGDELELETQTLRVRARVTDVEYGVSELPSNSFFDKLTVNLAVWVLP
jgi:hypothetical protein